MTELIEELRNIGSAPFLDTRVKADRLRRKAADRIEELERIIRIYADPSSAYPEDAEIIRRIQNEIVTNL